MNLSRKNQAALFLTELCKPCVYSEVSPLVLSESYSLESVYGIRASEANFMHVYSEESPLVVNGVFSRGTVNRIAALIPFLSRKKSTPSTVCKR